MEHKIIKFTTLQGKYSWKNVFEFVSPPNNFFNFLKCKNSSKTLTYHLLYSLFIIFYFSFKIPHLTNEHPPSHPGDEARKEIYWKMGGSSWGRECLIFQFLINFNKNYFYSGFLFSLFFHEFSFHPPIFTIYLLFYLI